MWLQAELMRSLVDKLAAEKGAAADLYERRIAEFDKQLQSVKRPRGPERAQKKTPSE